MVILTYNYNLGCFSKFYLFKTYNLPQDYCFSGKVCETIKAFSNKNPLALFIKNNKLHRYYGPAAQYKSLVSKKENYSGWHLNGTFFGYQTYGYSQSKFLKDINKKWLS